jgi:hypothetical protein
MDEAYPTHCIIGGEDDVQWNEVEVPPREGTAVYMTDEALGEVRRRFNDLDHGACIPDALSRIVNGILNRDDIMPTKPKREDIIEERNAVVLFGVQEIKNQGRHIMFLWQGINWYVASRDFTRVAGNGSGVRITGNDARSFIDHADKVCK